MHEDIQIYPHFRDRRVAPVFESYHRLFGSALCVRSYTTSTRPAIDQGKMGSSQVIPWYYYYFFGGLEPVRWHLLPRLIAQTNQYRS